MKLNRITIAAVLAIVAGAASAQSTTLGTGATAQNGVAIGNNATQANVTGDVFGTGTPVNYTGGIAIGNGTFAAGKNIAIGDGLQAIQDGVPNSYSLVIGGLNYNNGQIEYRRIVGMANGLFATDGANLGQVWAARDYAITTANAYTNTALAPINFRLGNVETQTANNTARLDQHDVILADHETRITTAQATADTALTVATGADAKATTALARSDEALATANQARSEVAALSGRIDEVRKDSFRGTASAMAMAGALPTLNPGEKAWYLRSGVYGGQAAIAGGIAVSTWAGHVFDVKLSNDGKRTGFSAGVSGKF